MQILRPRDGSDGRFYAPARDLAYLAIPQLRAVCDRLARESWPPAVADLCLRLSVSEESLGRLAASVARFVQAAGDPDVPDFEAAWRQSGLEFWESDLPGELAVFTAALGRHLLPLYFTCIRDLADGGPIARQVEEMTERANRLLDWSRLPRWVRWLAPRVPESWGVRLCRWALARRRQQMAFTLRIYNKDG